MLKNLKKIKWYRWLFLAIYISLAFILLIGGDIAEEVLKSMPLDSELLPYIKNYYEFYSIVQLIHLITCFTLLDISAGLIIIKGFVKDVKKEN